MRGRLLALALSCTMLNGCVAVLAPVAAAGALGGKQVLGRKGGGAGATRAPTSVPAPQVVAAPARVAPVTTGASVPAVIMPPARTSALPSHGWRAMVTLVAGLVQAKTRPVDSAVLAPGATAAAPRFLPCGTKPFAVIVDAEGTVLPRSDAVAGTAVRTDEAVRSFGDVRFGQVTVLFTSSSPPSDISATEAALERARLGPAMQGRELLSAADGAAGASKAALRVAAANHYCVLALVGDDPEDFADLPVPAGSPWGTGWFRIPAQAVP